MNYFSINRKVSKVGSSAIFISIAALFIMVMFLLSDLSYADSRSRKILVHGNDSVENSNFAKDRNLLNTLGQVNSYSGSKPKTDLKSRLTLSVGAEAIDDNLYLKDKNVRPLKKGVASGATPSLQTQVLKKNGQSIAQTIESRIKYRLSNATRDQVSKNARAQAKNIRKLYQESMDNGGFDAQFNAFHGTPRFIKGPALTPKLQLNKTDLTFSHGVARNFLSKNAALFKLDDPTTELSIHRQNIDDLGKKHFHFQQRYKDLPVWGKQLSIHIDDYDSVYFINGTQIPTPKNFDVTPQISADQAIDLTMEHLNLMGSTQMAPIFKIFGIRDLVEPLAELVIYPTADGLLRLAYKVEILPKLDERWIYFIDAKTGEYVHRIFNVHHAPVTASGTDLNSAIRSFSAWEESGTYYAIDPTIPTADPPYDPLNSNNTSGDTYILDVQNGDGSELYYVTSGTQNSGWDPAGVSAAYNTRQVYDYYRDTHNRESIDDNGMNLMIAIHFKTNYNNAFWNGTWMVYGDGDNQTFSNLAGALDVAAHEMTHGVIENTAGLIYENQSGALNESFADVFGVMVDNDDWLLGEDITVASPGHLRNMANPADAFSAQPTHMDEYQNLPNTENGDWGGVHVNSGIPNRACYLIAEGLTAEGLGTSIGRAKTEAIYYRALTTYLQASSDFLDASEAIRQAAEDLYGSGSTEETAVETGFTEVGIGSADLCSSTGGGAETDTDPLTGNDIMVYLFPNDYSHSPFADECYSLWSYSRVPETDANYDSNLDILLNTGGLLETDPNVCNTTSSGIFPFYTRPAVYTVEGYTDIFYVGTDNNIYAVYPDGTEHEQITTSGDTWSIALSPDGNYFAYTSTSAADNNIYIIDLTGADNHLTVELIPADYQNGGTDSTNTIYYADSLAFDYTSTRLVFDALNCVSTPTSSCASDAGYQFWSIGFIDIDTAKVSYPFPNQNPIFDVGYPAFASNNSYVIAMDILDYTDYSTDGTIAEGVYTFNRETQDLMPVASPVDGSSEEGLWGAPTFWGDDDYVNMQTFQATTAYAYRVPIDSSWAGDPGNAEQVFPYDTAFPVIHRVASRDLAATLDVSSTALNFGTSDIGSTVTRTLTLTNSGNRDINIFSMNISGSGAFSQNCTNALLPKGATLSINIRFRPDAASSATATFTIDSDADTPSTVVSLSGTGQTSAVDYDGTYSGTFSGDDNGYWVAVIDGATAQFIAWSTTYSGIDYDQNMSVDGSGNFSGTTDFRGADFSGQIVNGVVSGTYSNTGTGDTGTITGEFVNDPSPFAGTYSGTYSGDSSGTWTLTISSDGYVTGTINTDAGNVSLVGGVGSNGRLIAASDDEAGIYGVISGDSISGNWVNYFFNEEGNFSGTAGDGGDGGGGGGGGGGGCFISTACDY